MHAPQSFILEFWGLLYLRYKRMLSCVSYPMLSLCFLTSCSDWQISVVELPYCRCHPLPSLLLPLIFYRYPLCFLTCLLSQLPLLPLSAVCYSVMQWSMHHFRKILGTPNSRLVQWAQKYQLAISICLSRVASEWSAGNANALSSRMSVWFVKRDDRTLTTWQVELAIITEVLCSNPN